MSEFEIFLELIDEKMLDYILAEFFSDNNPKLQLNVKKIKLQKLLRESVSSKMKKAYRKKGLSCLQIVKMSLADEQLLDCDIDDFIKKVISSDNKNLSDLELFCTAYIKFPDIIKDHFNMISQNHKENKFLFEGIEEFNIPTDYLDSVELNKLQADIKKLQVEIEKIKIELEVTKKDNKDLSIQKNDINNENKKLKKEIHKHTKEINKITEEKNSLNNVIEKNKTLIEIKDKEINQLKNENKKIQKDKDKIEIKFKEFKNKEYLEIDDEHIFGEYNTCLIYTTQIIATRSLFKNILFKSYDEYIKDSKSVIGKLKDYEINNVYIMSNNISMRELGSFKRTIKKEGINCKTILYINELDMIKELIKDTENDEIINWI